MEWQQWETFRARAHAASPDDSLPRFHDRSFRSALGTTPAVARPGKTEEPVSHPRGGASSGHGIDERPGTVRELEYFVHRVAGSRCPPAPFARTGTSRSHHGVVASAAGSGGAFHESR